MGAVIALPLQRFVQVAKSSIEFGRAICYSVHQYISRASAAKTLRLRRLCYRCALVWHKPVDQYLTSRNIAINSATGARITPSGTAANAVVDPLRKSATRRFPVDAQKSDTEFCAPTPKPASPRLRNGFTSKRSPAGRASGLGTSQMAQLVQQRVG